MDFLKDLSIDKVRNLAEDTLNQVKPKTDVEARVYDVLSHKNWGASSTLMNEIARDTYDYDRFAVVTRLMWEAIETQRPAAWKIVFKGLTLLEHLIKNGSEKCVDDGRNHGHALRRLGQFNYYEGTIDRGLGVREKSKQILEMLSDDERVREERQRARKLREKFGGKGATASNAKRSGGANKYSGYGNSDGGWDSGGGGGGGYGEGGIDSGRGGTNSAYSGRYASDNRSANPAPTFATIPDEGKKKKSKKKSSSKKKQSASKSAVSAPAPAPAAPEVDLFSFDAAPAPTPAAAAPADDDFANFAAAAGTKSEPAPAVVDEFDAFASARVAPVSIAPPPAPPQAAQPANDAFGAFSAAPAQPQVNGMTNAFGSMTMAAPPATMAPVPTAAPDDDEFGDFGGSAAPAPAAVAAKSNDPFGTLVSLDGLSKNEKKEKPAEPAFGSNAGATHQQAGVGVGAAGGMSGMAMPLGNPVAGGSDAISSMMDPASLAPKAPTPQKQPQQPQVGGMPGVTPQMMQQMTMMMQQQGQQVTPQMMQQMMMMMMQQQQQQGGGGMPNMNGMGGMNPQMNNGNNGGMPGNWP